MRTAARAQRASGCVAAMISSMTVVGACARVHRPEISWPSGRPPQNPWRIPPRIGGRARRAAKVMGQQREPQPRRASNQTWRPRLVRGTPPTATPKSRSAAPPSTPTQAPRWISQANRSSSRVPRRRGQRCCLRVSVDSLGGGCGSSAAAAAAAARDAARTPHPCAMLSPLRNGIRRVYDMTAINCLYLRRWALI